MADAEQEAANREREENRKHMQRVSTKEFHKSETSWDAYIDQFEMLCEAKGLDGNGNTATEARHTLLLAYVGTEPLGAVTNYFFPDSPRTKTYQQVKDAFQELFSPGSRFSPRSSISRRHV